MQAVLVSMFCCYKRYTLQCIQFDMMTQAS
jgi:hypothetical protein